MTEPSQEPCERLEFDRQTGERRFECPHGPGAQHLVPAAGRDGSAAGSFEGFIRRPARKRPHSPLIPAPFTSAAGPEASGPQVLKECPHGLDVLL